MPKKKKSPTRFTTVFRGRLIIVFLVIVCLFLVLAGRLIYLNVQRGDRYETIVLGQQNHTSSTIACERGKIYDRNGNVLATNEKIYTLVLEPKNIIDVGEKAMTEEDEENEVLETTIAVLHEYFGFDEEDLRTQITENASSYYLVYKTALSYDEVADFQEFLDKADLSYNSDTPAEEKAEIVRARNVEGVRFEENYRRVYPYDTLACRALGFASSGSGNWGIEQYYDEILSGTNGRSYNYFNEELEQEETVIEATNGNSVVSTIDMQIQRVIEEKLANFDEEIGSKTTNNVVMNPQNGEILGMASSNPYNLNDPQDESLLLAYYSQEEIDDMKAYTKEVEEQEKAEAGSEETEETLEENALAKVSGAMDDGEEDTAEETEETDTSKAEEDADDSGAEEDADEEEEDERLTIYEGYSSLWKNPVISDTYEPGSTYKPFTVSAGLESGALTGDEEFYCTGSFAVGGRNIGCSHVHDGISLKNAVAKSCNVSMMNIALNYEGGDLFYEYQALFGFGSKTGIDLPGEVSAASLVYTAQTYDDSAVTLATNSFGQNFNCSMIQMITAFSSLINGGYYYKPMMVKEIQDDSGAVVEEKEPEVVRRTISEETSEIIRSYLKEVVETGTGTKAQIPGYSVGGKTGTAEKYPRDKENYYISFLGFTPTDDPQVLIYVTIDEPNVDEQANAGLAVSLEKECMKEIIEILGLEPTEEITEVTTEESEETVEEAEDEEIVEETEDEETYDEEDSYVEEAEYEEEYEEESEEEYEEEYEEEKQSDADEDQEDDDEESVEDEEDSG